MSEISKQALLEWLDVEIDLSSGHNPVEKADRWAFRHVKKTIESGAFNADQGEVQRIRTALEQILEVAEDSPVKTYQRMEDIAREALSTTEPTGVDQDEERAITKDAFEPLDSETNALRDSMIETMRERGREAKGIKIGIVGGGTSITRAVIKALAEGGYEALSTAEPSGEDRVRE